MLESEVFPSMALEYIEEEIRKLESRKNELEQMSERLMLKKKTSFTLD